MAAEYADVIEIPDEEMDGKTFKDAYKYADLVYSQHFEGIDNGLEWNDFNELRIGLT